MATNPNSKAVPIERERELVSIFDTADEAEALIVQGLLESHGVEALSPIWMRRRTCCRAWAELCSA